MKKHFKFLPFLFLGFCLVLNSCSREENLGAMDNQFEVNQKSNNSTLDIISNVSDDLNVSLTVDENISEENAIYIETEEELRKFISDQRNLIGASGNPQYQTEGCADGIYTGSAMTSGFATLNFDVSITDGCISGITGGFSGWTLGVGYSQGETQFGCGSGTVCGSIEYSLFFQGVGTLYSESVCYSISMNC